MDVLVCENIDKSLVNHEESIKRALKIYKIIGFKKEEGFKKKRVKK